MPTLTLKTDVRSVPEQISELRDNCPHSIALSLGGRQLSYEELDRKADEFAGYLVQVGIVAGGTVAICMERSFDWIVSALGIMRAGAAYVPLDPAWPDSRLRYAVNDSGATVLVAPEALLTRLKVKARGIDPCRDAAATVAAPELARRPIRPESLAYVIYTSGSTGVPKGVEITHANLAHLIRWHRDAFQVTRQDRASHLAGLGFDAAGWEIWPNLCAGATVCLAEDGMRSSPELIQQWMIRERVTIGFVPTVHAAPMMAMEWPAGTALRLLLTGGDELRQGPAIRLPFEVVNNYGPTECTVVATSSLLKTGSGGRPPIGRPIAGASVYLLGEHGEPVPDGSTGEIYIGGDGVGRGYRNLPDLTGQSFLADPFTAAPGARMYRTGDRGVRRPDGEIEFRGRRDRQTKIRGQRVELDEIGSILTNHPSVAFAAAIASVSKAGENQLAAYVLPKENASLPTVDELQKHLLRSLPDYMIPTVFVRLHALPLSPNGKLDLTMLAPPSDSDLLERMPATAPASAIEEKLLSIMRELLDNDAVAADDNFFLAGGHSLLGMQLVMRLRNAFGVDLSLRQLFEAPTVARLASLIETKKEEGRIAAIWADLLGRKSVGLDDNFFDLGGNPALLASLEERIATEFGRSIPAEELRQSPTVRQQAELTRRVVKTSPVLPPGVLALQPSGTRKSIFWVHYLNGSLAKALGEDQPFLSVVLISDDFPGLGKRPTLQSIAACLLQKILATQPRGPYTIGGYCAGGILAFEVASQLRAAGREVSLLVLLDAHNPAYLQSSDSLASKWNYLRYVLKRTARLGLWTSLLRLGELLLEGFARVAHIRIDRSDVGIARELLITAIDAYRPQRYEGKVLLLLASERPPHVDLLPGWQAVVPHDLLHAQYVEGHRKELIRGPRVRSVADAIVAYLSSMTGERSMPCGADPPGLTTSCANGEIRQDIAFDAGWR